jgi:hypothetical protein
LPPGWSTAPPRRARQKDIHDQTRDGDYSADGVGGSFTEIWAALKSLVAGGVVILHGTWPKGVTVSIDLHWIPAADELPSPKGSASRRSRR